MPLTVPAGWRRRLRVPRWWKLPAFFLPVALVASLVAIGGRGAQTPRLALTSGSIWLASDAVDQATLLDGSTARVEARVGVSHPPGQLTQVSGSGVNADALFTGGAVSSINGTTDIASDPIAILPGATESYTTATRLYVLDSGRQGHPGNLAVANPTTLQVQARIPLPRAVTSATLDGAGRLWMIATNSALYWADAGRLHHAARPPGNAIGTVGGAPVVVRDDTTSPGVVTLNPTTGHSDQRACLDASVDDPTLRLGSSPAGTVYATSSRDGTLLTTNLVTGECPKIDIAKPGDQLGPPVAAQGRVFVPDYRTGGVVIIDVAKDSYVSVTVLRPPRPKEFQLLTKDGIVYYNNPDGDQAGVITSSGLVKPVRKYDPAHPAKGLATTHLTAPAATSPTLPTTHPHQPGAPPVQGTTHTSGPSNGTSSGHASSPTTVATNGPPTTATTTTSTSTTNSNNGQGSPSIDTSQLPPAAVGDPYNLQLSASRGVAPYTWTVANLPPGLTATAAGTISGIPTKAETSDPVSLQVTDNRRDQASRTLALTVNPPGVVTITTKSLAPAVVGQPYSQPLAASGGKPHYTWTATGLPPGLRVTAGATAQITGTPLKAGNATVTLTAQDAAGQRGGPATYVLQVAPAPSRTPVVTGLTPTGGSAGGGTRVTITGTDLQDASGVSFGSNPATSFRVTSPTAVTAVSPAGGPNTTVDVIVTTPQGKSATTPADKFTYSAPTVTSLSPNSGPPAGGTTVTINGANLTGAQRVDFDQAAATNLTVNADGSITVKSPSGTAGQTVDVVVTTPLGTSAASPADKFTYGSLPAVTSLSPASGLASGNTTVTIHGANLAGAQQVAFGQGMASNLTSNPDGSITLNSPPGQQGQTVDVVVTTTNGASATNASDQFTYLYVPSITGVTDASSHTNHGPWGGHNAVNITGANFTSDATVALTPPTGQPEAVPPGSGSSPTNIPIASMPQGSPGLQVSLSVTTPGGTSPSTSSDQYVYDCQDVRLSTWDETAVPLAIPSGTCSGNPTVAYTGQMIPANAGVVQFQNGAATFVPSPQANNSTTEIVFVASAPGSPVIHIFVTAGTQTIQCTWSGSQNGSWGGTGSNSTAPPSWERRSYTGFGASAPAPTDYATSIPCSALPANESDTGWTVTSGRVDSFSCSTDGGGATVNCTSDQSQWDPAACSAVAGVAISVTGGYITLQAFTHSEQAANNCFAGIGDPHSDGVSWTISYSMTR